MAGSSTEPPAEGVSKINITGGETQPPLGEDGKPLSKSAIKKLVKEQDKANKEKEKAAKRAALEEEQRKAAANDHSTHLYGKFPIIKSQPATNHEPEVDLEDLKLGDSTVTIRARAYNLRAQSAKLAFLMLRQEQSSVQAVVAASDLISKHMVKWIGSLNAESIVLVSGLVKEPVTPIKSATLSHLEIQIQKVFLVSEAQAPLTIQPEDCRRPEGTDQPTVSQATKLNNRALDLRTAENNSILNISSGVCEFYQTHLRQLKFKEVHTPKLNNAASEGGSNVFEVKYFDQKAYLAQSPQLYKQMLIAGDQRRIFEIADVFRAEDSNTNRHLTEYTSMDFEMEIKWHYHEVLDVVEGLFVEIFKGLKEKYAKDIKTVAQQYSVQDFKFPEDGHVLRLKFVDGAKMLREAGYEQSDDEDLNTENERELGNLVRVKHGTDFFILDQYPLSARPFYTMPSAQDPKFSNSFDIIMRGEEICSGAQRVHDHDLLCERMLAHGLKPQSEAFEDYVNAFKFGCSPHGGVGIGLERIVKLLLGLPSVKQAGTFPRDPSRLRP